MSPERRYQPSSDPERDDPWPNVRAAVELVANRRKVSLGAACQIVCEACASGEVRSRSRYIQGERHPLTRRYRGLLITYSLHAEHYRGAAIDLPSLELVDGQKTRHKNPEVNLADLEYWLVKQGSKRRSGTGKTTKSAAVAAFIVKTYPKRIPPGVSDKSIARDFKARTNASVSERTVRRARQ